MTKLLSMSLKTVTILAILTTAMMTFFTITAWLTSQWLVIVVSQAVVSAMGISSILAMGASLGLGRLYYLKRRAEMSRDRVLAHNEARQANIQSDRQQMHLVAEGRMMAAAVRQIETGLIHPSALGEGAKFSSFPASVIKSVEAELPLLEAPPKELLPAIRGMQNLLIIGGRGTGKTTLLQHLESERIHEGQTIALDSHAVPGQWAGQSIGAGRNYGQIKNAMIALVDKMDGRHKERTAGKLHFEPVHTLIDEFTLLPGYLKDAGYNVQSYSFPLLTEGRKANMNCVWGSHSDRAKPLGLEGLADLRECFDCLVYLKKIKGEYFALVDFGQGKEETRYTLPGPFIIQNAPAMLQDPDLESERIAPAMPEFIVADPGPEPDRPTEDEMKAIEAFVSVRDSGKFSWRKATKTAYGGKFGDGPNTNLRATLDKFGIDYSDHI